MPATEFIGGIEMEMVRVVKSLLCLSRATGGSENSQDSLKILSLL